MQHSPGVIAKIAEIRPGQGPRSYRRLRPDVASTLVAGHRALPVHPVGCTNAFMQLAGTLMHETTEQVASADPGRLILAGED
jgi:hypothetical protein